MAGLLVGERRPEGLPETGVVQGAHHGEAHHAGRHEDGVEAHG